MASREDVVRLLWHYQNLHDDTHLLVEFCGMRQRELVDGFRDVCEEIAALEKQLKGMKK